MTFDAIRFLKDHFIDADGIVGLLSAYGLTAPPRDTVRKWFQRGSIPSDWFPLICCVAELERGEPVRLAPYVGRGQNNRQGAGDV